ncbi:sulfide:quinone oxidoreductase [Brevundimonas bullata]|uniref:Sulfide:quinone oxidoreductase n=1 Tax=Brevundimonas bullata TaxID=13160 RepID=A0A7W7IMV1_9CAUL|nr:TIGR01244 family sulfur transferase [Brevundimonas bullata]MBB4797231.1 sulfide:quinone oxidoreductase [Brevundimonas bullata]MBB6382190.1 sulfide:quinone oxidoreductase [Brevundimonas bullata]
MNIRNLSTTIGVCGQPTLADVAQLVRDGVTVLVSHRPDDEEPGQPDHAELASVAEAGGARFIAIPVSGLPSTEAVRETAAVITSLGPDDRAVFFCRSGMRSAATWAMAERLKGADADALRDQALAAGYDLSRLPL